MEMVKGPHEKDGRHRFFFAFLLTQCCSLKAINGKTTPPVLSRQTKAAARNREEEKRKSATTGTRMRATAAGSLGARNSNREDGDFFFGE
jgi:hypothetical protein